MQICLIKINSAHTSNIARYSVSIDDNITLCCDFDLQLISAPIGYIYTPVTTFDVRPPVGQNTRPANTGGDIKWQVMIVHKLHKLH